MCHIVPAPLYRTIPYHTIPHHIIPYHTIPYRTVPYRTVLYCAMPCHAMPCHAMPYDRIRYDTPLSNTRCHLMSHTHTHAHTYLKVNTCVKCVKHTLSRLCLGTARTHILCIYMYVCMYVCVCIYIYIMHTHVNMFKLNMWYTSTNIALLSLHRWLSHHVNCCRPITPAARSLRRRPVGSRCLYPTCYVYVYVYIYIYIHIHIYIHIYTHLSLSLHTIYTYTHTY